MEDVTIKAKVAERGQVTIPKKLRDHLGIRHGTMLEFVEKTGQLIVRKVDTADPVDRAFGSLGRGRHTDGIVRSLRGEE